MADPEIPVYGGDMFRYDFPAALLAARERAKRRRRELREALRKAAKQRSRLGAA
jgi:hypothetical protein